MAKITDHLLPTEKVLWQGKAKSTEYLITNQRVIIYSNKSGKDPRIINLYEVNGQIEMKYNRHRETGDIYIPTPQWNRFVTREYISPDIKDIKEPYKVYNILIEAVMVGKRNKWK